MWESLTPEVRAALVRSELEDGGPLKPTGGKSDAPTVMSRNSSSLSFLEQSSCTSSSKESDEHNAEVRHETCPVSGALVTLTPVERAPNNVFAFTKTHRTESSQVVTTPSATVTTTTQVVSNSRGWRNVFTLPIAYDVNMVAHGTLLDAANPQLLDATGVHPEGYHTRFAVVDAEVQELYGERISGYFSAQGIALTTCVVNGGEADKRQHVSGTGCVDVERGPRPRRRPRGHPVVSSAASPPGVVSPATRGLVHAWRRPR